MPLKQINLACFKQKNVMHDKQQRLVETYEW